MAEPTGLRDPLATPHRARWSAPVESLLATEVSPACDVLVIGSGYGGSFAALELAAPGRRVWVIERGREFAGGEFPETLGDAPGQVQYTRSTDTTARGAADAMFDLRIDDDASVLVGCGLGGGSLINAGVTIAPPPAVFDDQRWPAALRADRAGLAAAFERVRDLLGAAPWPDPGSLPKYRALARLARAIPGACIEPAPIAVTTRDGPNAVGVVQRACIGCGNCVTGCNHDAKNTLTMNAIPLAIERGARFFTGARAVSVAPVATRIDVPGSGSPARWRVRVQRMATVGLQQPAPDAFDVHAHVVVIAAGTLGSVELLMRSRAPGFALSPALGARVSGNGDLLAFGLGQSAPVEAVARAQPGTADAPPSWARIGPTIVGVVRDDPDAPAMTDARLPPGALLEDGAMPAALRPLLGTLLATTGYLHGYLGARRTGHERRRRPHDPIGAPDEDLAHAQVLLAMGPDAGSGRMWLQAPDAPGGAARLRLSLAYAPADPTIHAVDAALKAARSTGFDGGRYVPNPAWQPVPDGGEALVGELPRRLVTVHPLGGCVMGDDPEQAVVDAIGTVYDPDGAVPHAVHAGLHVLDGAIVPMPVGVNPMLTIAALALRAARSIDAALSAGGGSPADTGTRATRVSDARTTPPRESSPVPRPDPDPTLRFVEVLATPPGDRIEPGALAPLLDSIRTSAGMPTSQALRAGRVGLSLRVQAATPLFAWVGDPSRPWSGRARLSVYDFRDGHAAPHATGFDGIDAGDPQAGADPSIATRHPIAEGACTLHLLRPDAPRGIGRWLRRAASAYRAYGLRRPRDALARRLPAQLLGRPPIRQDRCPPDFRVDERVDGARGLRGFADRLVAATHGARDWFRALSRHTVQVKFDYAAELHARDGVVLHLAGGKQLAYARAGRNPWDALFELDVTVRHGTGTAGPWRLRLDLLELLSRGVYQVDAVDTPATIAGLAAAGGLWLRAAAQTHYWSFAGGDYRITYPVPAAFAPLSTLTLADGTRVAPRTQRFVVRRRPLEPGDSRELTLRLSRYRAPGRATRGPLLMIHGLAHGGEVFTTDTVDRPHAARFVDDGWDVWVLDHRLSNFLGDTPRQSSTIDDVAAADIPRAFDVIERALAAEGRPTADGIRVFAHCIGAAALAMAVLHGRLTRAGRSRISALVLHAVHPWTVPSRWNRVSAALAAFYQDVLGDEVVDPIPPAVSTGRDQLVDRLAAAIPWGGAGAARHRHEQGCDCATGWILCNRMTLFYGREWDHANLTDATHATLHRLVGPAHVDVFRQIAFIALRQRLTDADGDNTYLRIENLRAHWTFPTLFATGRRNAVFDPASAARSYLTMTLLRAAVVQSRAAGRDTLPGPLPGRAGLLLPDGLGHMDFLFGRHNAEPAATGAAGAGLQDALAAFVADPDAWLDAREADPGGAARDRADALALSPRIASEDTPWLGPMLQYVRSGDTIELRVWVELRSYHTERPAPCASPGWSELDLADTFTRDLPGAWIAGDIRLLTARFGVDGAPPPAPAFPREFEAPLARIVDSGDPGPAAPTAPIARPGTPDAVLPTPHVPGDVEALLATVADTPVTVGDTWSDAPWLAHLRELMRAGDDTPRTVHLLLASCRWPGLAVERDRAADPVRRMLERVRAAPHAAPPVDGLLLLGDQIYADAYAEAFDTQPQAERAVRRYREAFCGDSRFDEHYPSRAMAELLASVPSWMIVDDHEFHDDWPGWHPDAPLGDGFRWHFAAALAYQWRQGAAPGGGGLPQLAPDRVMRGLWQSFEVATLPCFALDTRTERSLRSHDTWQHASIMHDAQFQAFERWLRSQARERPDTPKLVLSAAPIGLPRAAEHEMPGAGLRADDWHGYPASARRLLRAVLDSGARNLVLLCGDPHYSCLLDMAFGDDAGRQGRLTVVVASGLNATLPFANGSPRELLAGRIPLPFSDRTLHATSVATPLCDASRHHVELSITCTGGPHWTLAAHAIDDRGRRSDARPVTLGEPPAH